MLAVSALVTLGKVALLGGFRNLIPLVALSCLGVVSNAVLMTARAGTPTYTTFDVPGQGTGDFLGAVPISVAPDGTVAGFMRDPAAVRHGFVRDPRGIITVFDAPNAGTGPVQGTHAYSITPGGTISGWYYDANFVVHAFLRTPEAIITVVDMPAAGNGAGQGTYSWWPAIAPSSTITGYYVDNNNVSHGFLRDVRGGITIIDVPAASDAGGGTQALAISTAGVVTGSYFDANGIGHGFVRGKNGSITTFDVPAAAFGTFPQAINPSGATSGFYFDANGTSHCFLRAPGGAVTTIDAPPYATAGSTCAAGVGPFIAPDGTVAVTYVDGTTGNDHAFLRDYKGAITNIDVPSPLAVNGTAASSIGANGIVVGNCADNSLTVHGFIRTP